ncbi:ribosome biogenesis protein bop1 isoform X2 [Oratosquilla oratoria]|uniref:ribosome biogenesis protein bop1 isoform X2 n=1 Tax=Oratosquilla oratoria TaxID=337810 RepID=UPI003F769DE9
MPMEKGSISKEGEDGVTMKITRKRPLEQQDVEEENEPEVDYMVSIDNEDDDDLTDSDSSEYSDLEDEDDDSDDLDDEDSEEGEEEEKGEENEEEEDKTETEKVKENGIESTHQPESTSKQQKKPGKQLVDKEENNDASTNSKGSQEKEYDEYEEDSSDEEDLRNTIGNVPLNWYNEYPHLGYDVDGKPILKPVRGDKLDEFLSRTENPDYFRTIFDKQTGQEVRLTDEDLDAVKRVVGSRIPDANYDMYEPWIDTFTHEVMEMPLSGRPEHKRSFIPSKAEKERVSRIVDLMKTGRWAPRKLKKDDRFVYYNLWKSDNETQQMQRIHNHMPAPKLKLPGHEESYNPPPEYLFTEVEKERWHSLKDEPYKRRYPFIPRKFTSVRNIPAWKTFLSERFERCLDLYLCPRKRISRIKARAKDLLPELPKPQDLRPFPTKEELIFKGHRSIIRTIAVHRDGKYLASGSDDRTVKIWEVSTGRCLRSFDMEGAVKCVSWNPNPKLFLLAVVVEKDVICLNPETYMTDKVVVQQTNSIFKEEPDQGDYIQPDRVKSAVTWRKATDEEWAKGWRIVVTHFKSVKSIVWHRQGDYFATVIPEGDNRSVLMHQMSRWRSQVPFYKAKGRVQCVQFHPKLPFLFVVTQSHIRVYNLQKQQLTKKVQANSKWVSSLAVHPGGEHFLIGCYDRRVTWFEMECTKRPHILRMHTQAVRSVGFHRKYPLFASCSDDGRIIVSHGMVYNDWLKDPLLVPVKELFGHDRFDDLYALDLVWHPHEPYLLTAGADATIRLWH